MIKPLNDFILLKKIEISELTNSGILMANNDGDKVAVVVEKSLKSDLKINPSDKVYFIEKNAINIVYKGEKFIIVKSEDIICVAD